MSRTAISSVALCAPPWWPAPQPATRRPHRWLRPPTRCDTGDLRASLLRSSPAAGQRYAHVQLTNISPRTCTIFGYAGAQLLRADGSRVPADIVRDHSRTPRLVTLGHGQRASASWHWSVIAGGGETSKGRCEPITERSRSRRPTRRRHVASGGRTARCASTGRSSSARSAAPTGRPASNEDPAEDTGRVLSISSRNHRRPTIRSRSGLYHIRASRARSSRKRRSPACSVAATELLLPPEAVA
ncbi:MAG: hypothetical protein QOD83_438 [Solirubrobacteraceae bacterium]|nr:hypothetical protein [Solirubrobacteraceae bacterium]